MQIFTYEYITPLTLLCLGIKNSILELPNPTILAPYGNNISVPFATPGAN